MLASRPLGTWHKHRRPAFTSRCQRATSRTAAAPTAATLVVEPAPAAKQRLLYDGILFDMDGTLSEAHIDFADMRARTGIPVGDLFTVMESWEEEEDIRAAMDVILEIEAEAAARTRAKEGLVELLTMLQSKQVKLALVTRNTTASVDAFFDLVGEQWRSTFSLIRTREFNYVKPDKRLLVSVALEWDLHPGCLLMVGDSFEDIEVGNAAGAATCLIAGGGNEKPGANVSPPPGARPTFDVQSLHELCELLEQTACSTTSGSDISSSSTTTTSTSSSDSTSSSTSSSNTSNISSTQGHCIPAGSPLALGWAASSSHAPSDATLPGAPAPGLDFLDHLLEGNVLRAASCSFPIMGAAAGGLAACDVGGESLLHVGCGDGGLTKMAGSKGLAVMGVDSDVAVALKRGLRCCTYATAQPLGPGSLAGVGKQVDAVLVYTPAGLAGERADGSRPGLTAAQCLEARALAELATVLGHGGRVCLEAPGGGGSRGAAEQALAAAGFELREWELWGDDGERVRMVAAKL